MKIYEEYAAWWPLLSDPSEYEDEADFFREAIAAHTKRPTHTVLDLGSGTGNVASHLKSHYTLTLTDISEKMLDVSRGINSRSEHIAGDMRTLRLGKTFDAVFVHDAVMYMTTRDDLRRAIETARRILVVRAKASISLEPRASATSAARPRFQGLSADCADLRRLRLSVVFLSHRWGAVQALSSA